MKCNVSISNSLIFENKRWVDSELFPTVTPLVSVVKKLAVADEESFGVGETAMADGGEGGGEAEEEEEEEEGEMEKRVQMGFRIHIE